MKAILVIDKPESCTSCMLGIYNKRWFCLATNEDINITDRYNIPKSCPLKPIPNIKTEEAIKLANMINPKATFQEFADGWNACLKEIENESRMD